MLQPKKKPETIKMINRAYFKNKSKVIETENVLHLTYDEEGSVRDFVVSYIPKRELHQHMQRILVNKPNL